MTNREARMIHDMSVKDRLDGDHGKHASNAVSSLPPELARSRIFDAIEAAKFWGVSLPHWRRLYRLGQVPKPIKLSARRLGWRVGDLIDALAARSAA